MSEVPSSGPGPSQRQFLRDVLDGLRRPDKSLPCKYFYDGRGSQLFEAICRLDEYYLTRTELAILRTHAADMARRIGSGCVLVEYGSGSGVKTRLLLDRLDRPAAYVPVDISPECLQAAADDLARRYPRLDVRPLCADFTRPFELPALDGNGGRRVVYFPGSTIGNFGPAEATELLTAIARLVRPGGGLLIGVDLDKPRALVEPAYNDSRGVTAAFNLNLLARINRELGANFDLDRFRHHAFYNEAESRVEMHLVSQAEQTVEVAGAAIHLTRGESIHTENSYKYGLDRFRELAAAAGLTVEQVWLDAEALFSVQYLSATRRA